MSEKRFSWEYSHYDSTGEIYDWKRKECLITDYLQKYEIEEWCQELNKIVNENEQLKKENRKLKNEINLLKLKLKEKNEGFDKIHKMYMGQIGEIMELKEKNEFVGLLANHRGEMVSFANALIQDLDDEKIRDMWEMFKDEMYKEWKQKRGIE